MSCGCKCSYCASCNSHPVSTEGTKKIVHNYGSSIKRPKDLYTKKQAD